MKKIFPGLMALMLIFSGCGINIGEDAWTGGDDDANLSGLTLSQGALSPEFSASVTSYTADVPGLLYRITVTPEAAAGNSVIKANGYEAASGNPSGGRHCPENRAE